MLEKIKLNNFKGGTENFKLSEKTEIFGFHESGKSRIKDAVVWCLTGKDSAGRGTRAAEVIDRKTPELPTTVELHFSDMELARTVELTEKRRIKTRLEIDGELVESKRKFNSIVEEKFGNEKLIFSSMIPGWFPEKINWDKRRKVILKIVGEPEKQVILDNIDGSEIIADLVDNSTGNKKKLKLKKKKGKDKIKELKARIDERKSNNNFSNMQKKEAEAEKEQAEKAIKKLREKLSGLDLPEKHKNEKELVGDEIEQDKLRIERIERNFKTIQADREKRLKKLIKDWEAESERKKETIGELRKDIEELRESRWTPSGDDVKCPVCGQELPAEQVEKKRKEWNRKRAVKIKNLTANKEKLNKELKTLKKEKPKVEKVKKDTVEIEKIKSRIEKNKKKLPEIEKALKNSREAGKQKKKIEAEITELEQKRNEKVDLLADIKKAEKDKNRVMELKSELQQIRDNNAKYTKKIKLLDIYDTVKADMMEADIEETLGVRVKMYEKNVSGDGMQDCCEIQVLDDAGVYIPYITANTANKMMVGAQLCRALQNEYNVELPCFLDNGESMRNEYYPLSAYTGQIVKLTVADNKILRVEKKE